MIVYLELIDLNSYLNYINRGVLYSILGQVNYFGKNGLPTSKNFSRFSA
jgi:hypothetical protein